MRLGLEQLAGSLRRGLAPVYILSGDEPLQLGEAADLVRKEARKAGYLERVVFQTDSGFNWLELREEAESLSLFSESRLIELRITSGKPGREGGKALQDYCKQLPDQTVLLVTLPKLTPEMKKSAWFKTLDGVGHLVQVWPLEGTALLKWLEQRMQRRGLRTDRAGLAVLADRVEGNLLAAAQEIEKLYVLFGTEQVSVEQIIDVVSNNARFNPFSLTDAVLAGKAGRAGMILEKLREEAVAPAVILWALAREARILLQLRWAQEKRQSLEPVFRKERVWDQRKKQLGSALRRLDRQKLEKMSRLAATTDRVIKGQEQGDAWEMLSLMTMALSGAPVLLEKV